MIISGKSHKALFRSEALVTEILKITDKLPSIFPFKKEIQEPLYNINLAVQGLRPPRVMVIGRCRSGKSSIINAICGLKVAEVSDTQPETGTAIELKFIQIEIRKINF